MESRFFWKDSYLEVLLPTILQRGGVVLGHSDTVFGLLAQLSFEGVTSLNRVKGRHNKPYLVLVENKEKALALIEKPISESLQRLMDVCWPGPLTLVCKARSDLPDFIKGENGTIAIRVPDHQGLQSLLRHVDGLFSTSANKAGDSVPACLEEVDSSLLGSIDCIVLNYDRDCCDKGVCTDKSAGKSVGKGVDKNSSNRGRGDRNGGTDSREASTILASTILDCTQSSSIIKVIRVGAYPISLIQEKTGLDII